ncbi:uncharacterized [Tachysurus ichikawai]
MKAHERRPKVRGQELPEGGERVFFLSPLILRARERDEGRRGVAVGVKRSDVMEQHGADRMEDRGLCGLV